MYIHCTAVVSDSLNFNLRKIKAKNFDFKSRVFFNGKFDVFVLGAVDRVHEEAGGDRPREGCCHQDEPARKLNRGPGKPRQKLPRHVLLYKTDFSNA
jgi:hypothetical protein